jgi:hypothetical protein
VPSVQSIIGKGLPNFGPYLEQRRRALTQQHTSEPVVSEEAARKTHSVRPAPPVSASVPTLSTVIGKAVKAIGTYGDLDNKQQVRSHPIDDASGGVWVGELIDVCRAVLHRWWL